MTCVLFVVLFIYFSNNKIYHKCSKGWKLEQFIITIADGKDEYPLNLPVNARVDLMDYTCRAITMKEMGRIRALAAECSDYQAIAEILEKGWELHIWKHKSH